jgi:hypothetical protein
MRKTYVFEEYVFQEGDVEKTLYFITNGKVGLIHKQTYTFIVDLYKDRSFGEICFFSDCPR